MRSSRRVVWLLALATSTAGHAALGAQQESPREILVRAAPGIVLGFSIEGIDNDVGARPLESWASPRDGEIYRVVVDDKGNVRFAYAMTASPTDDGAELSFRPLRLHETVRAFASRRAVYDAPFTLDGSLSTLREPQDTGSVRVGDVVRLDLFEHTGTGNRISDVVRVVDVSAGAVRRLVATRTASPIPVTLTLSALRVRRDGVVLAENRPGTFAAGHIVVVGLPGRGQLAFSAEPDPRVPPSGTATVDGGTLRFNLDGHEYELVSNEPVGPSGLTTLSMYVSDNPGPAMYKGRLWIGSAPSIDVWLSQTRQ